MSVCEDITNQHGDGAESLWQGVLQTVHSLGVCYRLPNIREEEESNLLLQIYLAGKLYGKIYIMETLIITLKMVLHKYMEKLDCIPK